MHELGTEAKEWIFFQYRVSDDNRLTMRLVDPSAFEDVIDDAASVRQRLAERLQDPELFANEVTCTRRLMQAGER